MDRFKRMMTVPHRRHGVSFIIALLLLLNSVGLILADDLPPRPPIEPYSQKTADDGAAIELTLSNPLPGAFGEVQWQGGHGNWHAVPGWIAALENGERQLWWVAPDDFATGPFRWVIYASFDSEAIYAGDPFNLPGEHHDILRVREE